MITLLVKLSMFAGIAVAAGGVPLPGLAYGKVSIKAPGYGVNLKRALQRDLPLQVFLPDIPTTTVPSTKEILEEIEEQIFPPIPEESIERLDEEYVRILEEIERRHRLWSSSHRDLQWHYVALVSEDVDNEQRADLLRAVAINPLFNKLSPTLAISPATLTLWLQARDLFYARLKEELDNE